VRQTTFAGFHCSLARALEVVGDWWTPLIIRDLHLGLARFDDLATDLGISRNLLARRLDHLVESGIVDRNPYSEHPPRYHYALSAAGAELVPILATLTAWGDRWQTPPGGPPVVFAHAGHDCSPVVCCAACGEAITAENLDVHAGPGGRTATGTRLVGRFLARREDDLS
jgi:DNA-binding HxlR family transcriptional regulator